MGMVGGTSMLGVVVAFWIFVAIIATLTTVFWIIEIVDIVRREFPDPLLKIVWVLIVIFFHFLGALIYYFVGKNQGRLPA
jgi:hypothetical protein